METNQGIIKRIMSIKKYGFILKEDGSDIFFHEQGLISPSFDELKEGMSVEFLIVDSPQGDRAVGVVAV